MPVVGVNLQVHQRLPDQVGLVSYETAKLETVGKARSQGFGNTATRFLRPVDHCQLGMLAVKGQRLVHDLETRDNAINEKFNT